MKITRIDVYQVDLPLKEGDYKWSEGKSVATFEVHGHGLQQLRHVSIADGAPQRVNGRMAAPETPGLGVTPKMDVLGDPVGRY